jgi:hypothetical protein
MKKPSNAILWIGFALCLTVIGAIDLSAQTPLSDEKKRNLRKFDPGDIFPDAREADQNKKDSSDSKSKSKRDRKRDAESEQTESVEETKPTPTPSPRASVSPANQALQPSPTASPASLQAAGSTDQNQEPPAPGSATASSGFLSLPILFVLVLATLGGLVATIFKLLKLSAQLGFRRLGSE